MPTQANQPQVERLHHYATASLYRPLSDSTCEATTTQTSESRRFSTPALVRHYVDYSP